MNVELLRKIERIVYPVFGVCLLANILIPRSSYLLNRVTFWASSIFFFVDVLIVILIYRFKDKREDVYGPKKTSVVKQVLMPFIFGIVLAVVAWTNRAEVFPALAAALAAILCFGFGLYLLFNREKLKRKGLLYDSK